MQKFQAPSPIGNNTLHNESIATSKSSKSEITFFNSRSNTSATMSETEQSTASMGLSALYQLSNQNHNRSGEFIKHCKIQPVPEIGSRDCVPLILTIFHKLDAELEVTEEDKILLIAIIEKSGLNYYRNHPFTSSFLNDFYEKCFAEDAEDTVEHVILQIIQGIAGEDEIFRQALRNIFFTTHTASSEKSDEEAIEKIDHILNSSPSETSQTLLKV